MSKKKIVALTGAGISAESGLKTFRDADGLWNGYDIYEVATPEGFRTNPALVLDFYNQRRKDVLQATPNQAHHLLAQLQQFFEVTIVTQNIDDLHERAGSTHIIHLHGEILKMRSTANEPILYPITTDIQLGDMAEDGFQLRPHVVWFNEPVPLMPQAEELVMQADILLVVGTSLQVYPAANLVHYTKPNTPIYVIDKQKPQYSFSSNTHFILSTATQGMQQLYQLLTSS